MKKVLLTNSYAVNNGDMALSIALYEELVARGYEVEIATFYFDFLKKQYPQLPLIRELLDYNFLKGGTFIKKIFLRINFRFNRSYRQHDAFIACPGGYMNSYYGIKRCLLPLVEAKKINKPTAVYSQSVGPFNERDKNLLTRYSRYIDVILVRDDYSKKVIESIPCSSTVFQTKDAAFLLPPRKSKADASCKTVAVSVREWRFDNRDMNNFYNLITSFCKAVLQAGFRIEFISTCQGVEGYRDDSKTALLLREMLVKELPDMEQNISVDTAYHNYYDLVERLNTRYCFTIGTRLHMCILSLINGTPAFNVSYEVKGIECYKYLGLDAYSVDYNEELSSGMTKFTRFLEVFKELKEQMMNVLTPVHVESKKAMDDFLKEMNL